MMRKCALTVTVVSVLLALASCEDDSRTKMLSDYHSDFDINYGLFHVYQYDEVNINGIDLASKFDFFNTFRLTLHYTDNEISAVTFDNGDVPFSPYSYEIPSGKVNAYLNTNVLPNELRLTDSEKVIAYYVNGEFSIPFKLDCPSLDYKYTFKSIQQ